MKFSQRQVADPAAQQNFEQLEGELPKGFLQLAAPLAAGRKVAFGSGTLNFTAGNVRSTSTTVTHGLSGTPVTVLALLTSVNTAGAGGRCNATNVGATTLDIWATWESTPGANFGATFYWLAIA